MEKHEQMMENGQNMDYEIITCEEKYVAGFSARTNNMAPDMGAVIGGLWQSFYQPGIYDAIPERKNEKALGIYTDYEGNEKNDYTVIVGAEIENQNGQAGTLPDGVREFTIPAGRYAKFIVKGHMQKAVAEFWTKLWNMDLPRAFSCDYEEYQNSSVDEAEIHMYISLKEG